MCGFIGATGLRQAIDFETRRGVLAALAHRGPDAEGELALGSSWLGFRRLAILDLESRSDQPMVHPSGLAMVFNGEIYNYVELRRALESKGHAFETSGDTEVLLTGYVEWGRDVFRRANGMWAVAIFDPADGSVVLSRDRFGEKPLYIGRGGDGTWWFGSEPSALRRAGAGSGKLNLDTVASMLFYADLEPAGLSYFDGIDQLPPGSVSTLRNNRLETTYYWSTEDELIAALERDEPTPDEVREQLMRSVAIRLRSDVRVGTSLSGGVDSTSIVACIRALCPDRDLHAFTASFPGHPGDEFDRAKLVADKFGVNLHRVEPTVDGFITELDALVEHQGGPFDLPSVYAQWCVMASAAQNDVTVLLDGQGADETWGGYSKYATLGLLQSAGRADHSALIDMVRNRHGRAAAFSGASPRIAGYLSDLARTPLLSTLRRTRQPLIGPALVDRVPIDPIGTTGVRGPLNKAMVADIDRSILPRLLRFADRSSMAWSREVRLPFLDPDMVKLGLASPWTDFAATGWGKRSLRQAMDGLVPDEVLWRRDKSAFDVPTADWLQDAKLLESIEHARRRLLELGLLTTKGTRVIGPWAQLSLARFIDNQHLTV